MPGPQCPLHLAPAPLPATLSMTPLDEKTMRIEQCSSRKPCRSDDRSMAPRLRHHPIS